MNLTRPRSNVRAMDLTPMIDVVLQLLIFFMFTSQFAQLTRTSVNLPEQAGDKDGGRSAPTITIDIGAEGRMLIESRMVEMAEVERIVRAEIDHAGGDAARVTVLLRSDRDLPALFVNGLALRLSALGVRGWRLGTSAPAGGGS
ncbi:MAG: biopolymer transporter ExbD [Phycisphaerales bacterium]|nr:biopolymer transporter ExbD [Phycisphaerales bacterium]